MVPYLLDLIDFIEEKIIEAADKPASRSAALVEAAGALPIIKDRLHREDQTALGQLMLIGFIEVDLGAMGGLPDSEFEQKMEAFRGLIATSRDVLKARSEAGVH